MMKSWKCPECGSINRDEVSLCECGYDSNRPFRPNSQPASRSEADLTKREERISFLTLKNRQPAPIRNVKLIVSLGIALFAVVLLSIFPLPSSFTPSAGTLLTLTILFIIDRLFTAKDWTRLRDMCVHAACLSSATIFIMFYSKPDAFKFNEIYISFLFGLFLSVIWLLLIYGHINKSISTKKGSFIFIPFILLGISFAYLEARGINTDVVAFLSMAVYSLVALLGVNVLENKLMKSIHIEIRTK